MAFSIHLHEPTSKPIGSLLYQLEQVYTGGYAGRYSDLAGLQKVVAYRASGGIENPVAPKRNVHYTYAFGVHDRASTLTERDNPTSVAMFIISAWLRRCNYRGRTLARATVPPTFTLLGLVPAILPCTSEWIIYVTKPTSTVVMVIKSSAQHPPRTGTRNDRTRQRGYWTVRAACRNGSLTV